MPARKRTDLQVVEERAQTARMYIKGMTQAEIGKKLGLSQRQISYDLAQIRKMWIKEMLTDFDELKSRELARVDNLEFTYWQAWERSQAPKETRRARKIGGRFEREENAVEQTEVYGDPRFLQGIERCIETRCKLLGLYAPTTIQAGVIHADARGVDLNEMNSKERQEQMMALLTRVGGSAMLGSGVSAEPGTIDVVAEEVCVVERA